MEATSWEMVPPEIGQRTFYERIRRRKLRPWFPDPEMEAGLEDARPRHEGARILYSEHGPSSARVCPRGRGRILQQNSAVPFMCSQETTRGLAAHFT